MRSPAAGAGRTVRRLSSAATSPALPSVARMGLPFPRRPTIVSRCCGRCSHGRARPNMAMRKRTRRILASRFDLGVKCGDGACEPFLKSGDKQWEETRPVTPGSPSLSRSHFRASRTSAFRAGVRGWLGDWVGRDAQGFLLRANRRIYLCRATFQYRGAADGVGEKAALVPDEVGPSPGLTCGGSSNSDWAQAKPSTVR